MLRAICDFASACYLSRLQAAFQRGLVPNNRQIRRAPSFLTRPIEFPSIPIGEFIFGKKNSVVAEFGLSFESGRANHFARSQRRICCVTPGVSQRCDWVGVDDCCAPSSTVPRVISAVTSFICCKAAPFSRFEIAALINSLSAVFPSSVKNGCSSS